MGGGGLIFSKCPRCGSNRIRRGYRRAPIWWRMFGRYHLLCNACNWEFAGWAIPGTVEAASARRRKKRAAEKQRQASEPVQESNDSIEKSADEDFVEELDYAENNLNNGGENKEENKIESTDNGAENHNRVKVKKRVRVKLKK